MAVTNGWGQAAKNNTNGFGKLATNNIGAGSIYDSSYAGDTALIGVSAAFSYSAASFTQADSNPTPTITGTTGGTFSGTSGLVFVSTSTGEINLSASTIAAHVVTYTVDGVQQGQTVGITAIPYQSTRSFSFDGVNDYFDCGTISSIPSATELSVSFWANTDSTSQNQVVFGDNSSTPIFSFEYWGSNNRMYFEYGTGTFAYLTLTSVVTAGSWHNVVLVYNASGASNTDKVKIYVDGIDKSSLLTYTGTIPATLSASIGDFWIGNGQNYNQPFNGLLDEVSLWNTALSSSAVTEIYNSGAPNDLESLTNASSSNLVAWYKMGE